MFHSTIFSGWWNCFATRTCGPQSPSAVPLNRPSLGELARQDPSQLPAFVRNCPVACKYLALLGPLDWAHFPERPSGRAWPGPTPAPRAPFVAAYLVKLHEGKRYMSDLRDFLVEHPALVWVLGFALVPSDTAAHGFDVEASLPSRKHLSRVLRQLPNDALQFLLTSSVHLLQAALPPHTPFGDAISLDTKHILAWVKENNPKAFHSRDRFDKTVQPKGDPDCKLGCKERTNQKREKQSPEGGALRAPSPETPTTDPQPASHVAMGEFYWGYASGVVATKVAGWGEFVLAEYTQTFDRGETTFFFPLMQQVEQRLGCQPRFGALDAGFDAFYVYHYFHDAGGFAAVPLANRGQPRSFDADGLPLCDAGLSMPVKTRFLNRTSLIVHERARYACPLLFPEPTGAVCPIAHAKWDKGGCVVTMATSIGARLRYQLDRHSDTYKAVYRQRSATERINSLAVEVGIERPKLRNRQSITNQNTLIYVLLNLRALQRIRAQRQDGAVQAVT